MWIVTAVCSDDSCAAEEEFVILELDELEERVCGCGYCLVALSLANFEPARPRPELRLLPPLRTHDGSSLAA